MKKTVLIASALLALGACKGGRSDYAQDGDTGAAAPATKLDTAASRQPADSTTGVSHPAGTAVPAGDTTAAHGTPAGAPPATKRP